MDGEADRSPSVDPALLLELLAERFLAGLRRAAAGHRLREVHAHALLLLAGDGAPASPSALAVRLGFTPGTVSQTLRLLEARGLIARGRGAGDRRSVRLELTPAGRDLAAELRAAGPWAGLGPLPDLEAGLRALLAVAGGAAVESPRPAAPAAAPAPVPRPAPARDGWRAW